MSNPKLTAIFDKLRGRLERSLSELPREIGNAAVNYSLDAFKNQGWEGKAWAKRKSKKDANRAIMVKSGRTRRSLQITYLGPGRVRWGSVGVPYAQVHNDGGGISRAPRSETFVRNRYQRGKKKGRFQRGITSGRGISFGASSYNMPQRQFIGDTPRFRMHLKEVAVAKVKRDLNL